VQWFQKRTAFGTETCWNCTAKEVKNDEDIYSRVHEKPVAYSQMIDKLVKVARVIKDNSVWYRTTPSGGWPVKMWRIQSPRNA